MTESSTKKGQTMNHLQTLISKALEASNWTIEDEGYEGNEDLVAITAYSFDGMINAFGYINQDGETVINHPGGSDSYKAEELLANLALNARNEDNYVSEGR